MNIKKTQASLSMGIRAWAAFRWTFYRVHSILFAHNNIAGRVTCDSRLLCDVPVPRHVLFILHAFFLNYVTALRRFF